MDAWFTGYHPTLATAVWMGYDKPRSLGGRESGGRAALPIWMDYMGAALKGVPETAPGETPAGLAYANGDWLYSEWTNGGWAERIADDTGVQYAQPPGLLESFRPSSLLELIQNAIRP